MKSLAHAFVHGRGRGLGKGGVEIARGARGAAERPDGRHGIGRGLGEVFAQIGAHDGESRLGDGDRMGERSAFEIDVDEGHDGAELQEAEPGHQIFGTILENERDHVAALDAFTHRPASEAVGAFVEGAVRDDAVLIINRRRVGGLRCVFLDDIDEGVRSISLDAAQTPEGSRHGGDVGIFARKGFEHVRINTPDGSRIGARCASRQTKRSI